MRRKFFLFFMFFFIIQVKSENLILDYVSIEKEMAFVVFHNYPDDIRENIGLIVDKKERVDFTLNFLNTKSLYSIIIDNSGSIYEEEIEIIKEKISFFLKNLKKDDLVNIDKVNDFKTNLYKLNYVNEETYKVIDFIQREGTYSRLYDAVLSNYYELLKLKKDESYKDYNYYLIFFSDGEDIKSKNKGKTILNLEGIPFFFFSYGDCYDKELLEPFVKLTEITKGKFLKEPDNDSIKNVFFDNENRYLLKFSINKERIVNSREYIVTIFQKDNSNNKIEFDLKKFFSDTKKESKKNYKDIYFFKFRITSLFFIILILIFLIFLGLFLLIKKDIFHLNFLEKKRNSKYKKKLYISQKYINNNLLNKNNINREENKKQLQQQKEQIDYNKSKYAIDTVKSIEKILTQESESIIVEYKTLKDNYIKRRYNRFEIFHSQNISYIETPDNTGEEIQIDSIFKIINIESDWIEVESEKIFLIDEDIVIDYLIFKVQKIEYNFEKENFIVKLYVLNEDKNLKDLFKISKEILATNKRKIFGSKDAVIESFLKRGNEMLIINDLWQKGELKKDKGNIILITNTPLALDIKIVVKYDELSSEYTIKKIEKINDEFYVYLI